MDIEAVIAKYENYINKMLSRYQNKHYFEDLKQEMYITLIDCVEKYREGGGAKFDTYLYTSLRRKLIRSLRYTKMIRVPEHIDYNQVNTLVVSNNLVAKGDKTLDAYTLIDVYNHDTNVTPHTKDIIDEVTYNLMIAKKYLSAIQYNKVVLYTKGYSIQELADLYRVSYQAMRGSLETIKKKLRHKYEEVN